MSKRADAAVDKFKERAKKNLVFQKELAGFVRSINGSYLGRLFMGSGFIDSVRNPHANKKGPGRRHKGSVNPSGTKLSNKLFTNGSIYGRVTVVQEAFNNINAAQYMLKRERQMSKAMGRQVKPHRSGGGHYVGSPVI